MIKRYYATKDNTITNAYGENLTVRGSDANMGASDILEVFSIYGQTQDENQVYSREEARIIIEFDESEISADILPDNTKYYLRLFNAVHGKTLPSNFYLEVSPLEQSWEEGTGLDMEDYSDLTYGKGSSWNEAGAGSNWNTSGGHFPNATPVQIYFDEGYENLEIDITTIVEGWIATSNPSPNYGLIIKLPDASTQEQRSYYTKMFYARGTSNFFKQPLIEARWDSQITDQRHHFYSDKPNTIYLYNTFRGELVSLGTTVTVSIYEDLLGSPLVTETAEEVSTGIYKADINVTTTSGELYDVWTADLQTVHTGSISVLEQAPFETPEMVNLVTTVSNKQNTHYIGQTSRFYFYIREKNWSPNIHTVASTLPKTKVYDKLVYKICKVITDEIIFDYNTSDSATTLSYDSNGNFFDLDINMLEPNYVYEIKLALFNVMTKSYQELPFKHRFRVVNNEY